MAEVSHHDVYVFDSDVLIPLFTYFYPKQFPSLWNGFNRLVAEGRIVSVREVLNEVRNHGGPLSAWAMDHQAFFLHPSRAEMEFVGQVFAVSHFQSMIREKERLAGKPVADPFLIAKAHLIGNGCVVSNEIERPKAAKIPNVCKYFGVACLNLEQFMERNGWVF
jgi:hypothetical protein